MSVKPFREVGECRCHEYQAGARMRELVRALQQEVRNAHRVIEELTRGRGFREKSHGAPLSLLSVARAATMSPGTPSRAPHDSGAASEPKWIQLY
jgi:hypothetical protein